jgi:hypothetical protein
MDYKKAVTPDLETSKRAVPSFGLVQVK